LLQPKGSGASEHKLMMGPPKGVLGGILPEEAAVVSLGTEVTGCGESIQGEVLAFCTFQGTVALIPDESKTRTADASGQGKQTEFGGGEVGCEVAGLYAAEVEAVGDGTGVVGLLCSDLLPQIDLALQSLRGEGGDVETVVVKNRVEKLQANVVEQLG